MEKTTLDQLLSAHSQRSQWEYKNFVLEPYSEFTGRAILSQLARLSEINDLLAITTQGTLALEMAGEKSQIESWLTGFSQEEIKQHLQDIESQESEYWTQRLGREAAVDILTAGKVSKPVMERAILLDEDNYRKFVESSTSILQVISSVTREVEQQMGIHNGQLPMGEPQ